VGGIPVILVSLGGRPVICCNNNMLRLLKRIRRANRGSNIPSETWTSSFGTYSNHGNVEDIPTVRSGGDLSHESDADLHRMAARILNGFSKSCIVLWKMISCSHHFWQKTSCCHWVVYEISLPSTKTVATRLLGFGQETFILPSPAVLSKPMWLTVVG
jgi:hypothetical protein